VAGSHGGSAHLDWVKNPSVGWGCTHRGGKSGFESPPTSEVEASEVVVIMKDKTSAFFGVLAIL